MADAGKGRAAIQRHGRQVGHAVRSHQRQCAPRLVACRVACHHNSQGPNKPQGARGRAHCCHRRNPEYGGAVVLPRLILPPIPARHGHGRRRHGRSISPAAAASAPPARVLRPPPSAHPVRLGRRHGGGGQEARARCLLRGLTQPARSVSVASAAAIGCVLSASVGLLVLSLGVLCRPCCDRRADGDHS